VLLWGGMRPYVPTVVALAVAACGLTAALDPPESHSRVVAGLACRVPCPPPSTCRDADGLGAPECVLADGSLACEADEDCPGGGECRNQRCFAGENCLDCGFGHQICQHNEDALTMCVLGSELYCSSSIDCRLVLDLGKCCPCPKARNREQLNPCVVDYPVASAEWPSGCAAPDCGRWNHCWPCPVVSQTACTSRDGAEYCATQ
jgi:hypothetical protein